MRRHTKDEADTYGFRWGPLDVTRLAHVPGRGYSLEVETDHQRMQLYVSEHGRVIKAYPQEKP